MLPRVVFCMVMCIIGQIRTVHLGKYSTVMQNSYVRNVTKSTPLSDSTIDHLHDIVNH